MLSVVMAEKNSVSCLPERIPTRRGKPLNASDVPLSNFSSRISR